jgi:unsaturated chondroitin disaccharide hydrolase
LCADFYLERTDFGADAPFGPGVPPNDWDEAGSTVESSAAAITASGLINLSQSTQDPLRAQQYENAALTIMDTLTTSEYLADKTAGWEGILKHGCYHQRKGLGVDESVMWGEHFFVEALQKAIHILEGKSHV